MSNENHFQGALPSNLDTFTYERLLRFAQDVGVFGSNSMNRSELIRNIRVVHGRRRFEATREIERRERGVISQETRKEWATKRLMKDLRELNENRLQYVCAMPLRENLFEWHVNLLTPKDCRYYPMVVHLVLKFTSDYPNRPPKCELMTRMNHSHVFGSRLCLDLLETHHSNERFSGWSSSYSVLSILMQLQSFLFEEQHRYTKQMIDRDIQRSWKVKCSCGHDPNKKEIFPVWPYWGRNVQKTYFGCTFSNNKSVKKKQVGVTGVFSLSNKSSRTNAQKERRRRYRRRKKVLRNLRRNNPKKFEDAMKKRLSERKKHNDAQLRRKEQWNQIPSEVWISIFSFLPSQVLLRFSKVNRIWKQLSSHPFLWKDELKCFHSRSGFREDSLGFGLNIQIRRRKIHQVSTPLDLIGRNAFFVQKVRKSPWNVPFTHWLPIFIDRKHWNECRSDFENLVIEVYQIKEFVPHLGVDLCCRLMTSMVVEIMKEDKHGSIKAIQGYSYFYRLLLWIISTYSNLIPEINYNIGMFIKDEKFRHKMNIPNLGDFISLLAASEEYDWEDVKESFIYEMFDRNALWIERKRRMVIKEGYFSNEMEVAFECVKVSLKFTLFHLAFLRRIRCEDMSMEEICRGYDRRYGKEETSVLNHLQQDIFRINEVTKFSEFFELVEYPLERRNIVMILEEAHDNLRRRGYNRRIDTSGCFLTGNFRRSMEDVRRMVKVKPRKKVRRRKSKKRKKKKKKKRNEEEEEEDQGRIRDVSVSNDGYRRRRRSDGKKKKKKQEKKQKQGNGRRRRRREVSKKFGNE